MRVKVLTVKQPWASLIVHGIKDIENRSWRTNFRGRILIHASGSHGRKFSVDLTDAQTKAAFATIAKETMFGNMPFGSIIGSVEIVDCVQNHPSIWADNGVYHWVLANPILFEKPIENVKGKLGLWNYDWEEVVCL
ncbi:ASCH domain-containing protein [uncultured Bacteroides sp.]|jgi:hypothetical protein|uniref:ASCH domain-containing protein n=1 Tax=uncultured Bacteroides sp. TaxID=162156 RepID=UPI00280B1596|nr:ASCH domain-containing protein [uncultured Bacteroides sp.]